MSEKRGSKLNRLVDRYVGALILCLLSLLLAIKRFVSRNQVRYEEPYLLVCFGAIGDLIVLTAAARHQLAGERVYLACSKLNLGAARLYQDFYAGIEPADLKDFRSIHRIARRFGVKTIYDSTQWANIGPLQVGLAELLGNGVRSVGFATTSHVRNEVYGQVVAHSDRVHELGNFVNLLAQSNKIVSNAQLDTVVPELYFNNPRRLTGKVLLHMWPSGNRSYLKAWPGGYWIALIKDLASRGYEVYLSGSPADQEKTEAFVHKVGGERVINLAGVYGLSELRQFIQDQVEFVVSVNTGVLHLAASCGVPVIGLHGGVNPVRWGPLGSHAVSLLPESGRSAYLHYGFEYPDDDQEAYVLDRLPVTSVIKAVDALLDDR